MRSPLVALPLVLAALVAGCAGDASSERSFEGEERAVADVVERLQSASEAGDGKVICDEVLATALTERIRSGGASCEQELERAIDDADDFDLEVEDVTVTGDTATATVRGRDRVRDFEFEREGSNWRATSLGT